MTVSSMVPRPIDLGLITEAAGETLEQIERWPICARCCCGRLRRGARGIFYATR